MSLTYFEICFSFALFPITGGHRFELVLAGSLWRLMANQLRTKRSLACLMNDTHIRPRASYVANSNFYYTITVVCSSQTMQPLHLLIIHVLIFHMCTSLVFRELLYLELIATTVAWSDT